MDLKQLESIQKKAQAASDAFEIYGSEGKLLQVGFDKNVLESITQKGSIGLSIQAVKDGRIGFSSSTKVDEAEKLVESALQLAPYGASHDYAFAPKADSTTPIYYDPSLQTLETEHLVKLGQKACSLMNELLPEAYASASFSVSQAQSSILTSEGQEASEASSGYGFGVSAEINSEGDFLAIGEGKQSYQLLPEEDIEEAVKTVAESFKIARKSAPLQKGKYKVLFTPEALDDLMNVVGASVNGLNIEKKTSAWVDALDQQVFNQAITIYDDPSLPEGMGSSAYDGEGTPTHKRTIIENGILRNFIHSRSSAAHCGHEITGNGQRSFKTKANPGFHNLVMEAGNDTLEDLMKQADGGVYAHNLLGVFTSNFLAGQVSGNISLGYLLQDKTRIGRVKNVALNINVFDLFQNAIVGISKQRKWVGGSSYLPYILLDGVALSTS